MIVVSASNNCIIQIGGNLLLLTFLKMAGPNYLTEQQQFALDMTFQGHKVTLIGQCKTDRTFLMRYNSKLSGYFARC